MHILNMKRPDLRSSKKSAFGIAAVACALVANVADAFAETPVDPVGVWQTIDDSTHQPAALVQITRGSDGTLGGKIIRGLGANNSPERRCTECSDERKDQTIQGMTNIREMKQDGDGWDGGRILDPVNGREYSCKMHLDASGQKLVVRGYIGVSLLGRSQTWTRYSDATEPSARN